MKIIIGDLGDLNLNCPFFFLLQDRILKIYGVKVQTDPFPAGTRGHEAIWQKHLAELRFSEPLGKEIDPIVRTFLLDSQIFGVVYHPEEDALERVILELQKSFEDHLVTLEAMGKTDKADKLQKLVTNIAETYLPFSASFSLNGPTFCAAHGCFTIEPSQTREEAIIKLQSSNPGATITAQTYLVRYDIDPDDSPFEGMEQEIKEAAQEGVNIKILNKGDRKVAGESGEERIWTISGKDGFFIKYVWFYPGVSQSGTRPQITLTLSAPLDKNREALSRIWNDFLASFRSIDSLSDGNF